MGERFYYQEELFFTRDEDRELGENQEKIVEMLRSNLAVGVVAGFFEEGYPIYFISHFALNNLGLNFGEFMERTGGRYLEAVYEKDRGILRPISRKRERKSGNTVCSTGTGIRSGSTKCAPSPWPGTGGKSGCVPCVPWERTSAGSG